MVEENRGVRPPVSLFLEAGFSGAPYPPNPLGFRSPQYLRPGFVAEKEQPL